MTGDKQLMDETNRSSVNIAYIAILFTQSVIVEVFESFNSWTVQITQLDYKHKQTPFTNRIPAKTIILMNISMYISSL